MTVAYRAAELVDRRFIVDGWVETYKTAFTAGMIQIGDWHRIMIEQVGKAIDRPDVRVIVAHDPDATDHLADLYGFIAVDTAEKPPLVYYVYVKDHHRRSGLARGLFLAAGVDPSAPFSYVCSTPMVRTLHDKIRQARWQPLLGRFPKQERRSNLRRHR